MLAVTRSAVAIENKRKIDRRFRGCVDLIPIAVGGFPIDHTAYTIGHSGIVRKATDGDMLKKLGFAAVDSLVNCSDS